MTPLERRSPCRSDDSGSTKESGSDHSGADLCVITPSCDRDEAFLIHRRAGDAGATISLEGCGKVGNIGGLPDAWTVDN